MKHTNRIHVILFFLMVSVQLFAQKKDEIVLTIGNEKVTKEEFASNYLKNNSDLLNKAEIKSPEEYLDLFVKYKIKVLEALSLGYDTTLSFRKELEGYRREIARPYLTDGSYTGEMLQTEYYRTCHERKVSHILIKVAPDSAPADTLAAWNKINDLREQALSGTDFNELAVKYSADPSALQNKGLLGYFTAFQMLYPFEDMAYKTPVGQVSEVVRTQFGYHMIKVHDERLAAGEIKVAHIMKIIPKSANNEIVTTLKLKIDSLWQRARAGEDFAELAKKYSDDKQSASQGGVLKWFAPTNMISSFSEPAFALKNDGDISPVIRTPFGWHIIKRLERREIPSFDKLRPTLETRMRQNYLIVQRGEDTFDRKLRDEYHLQSDEEKFNRLVLAASDSVTWKGVLSDQLFQGQILITFVDQKITVGQFLQFLHEQIKSSKELTDIKLKNWLQKFIHQKLMAYEDARLDKKYPEFAQLYKEYHDGILLFNVSKNKIWDAAASDTARLEKYFEHTSKKYYWDPRFEGYIIETKNLELRSNVEKYLETNSLDKSELSRIFNHDQSDNLKVTEVMVEKGKNPVVDYFIWGGIKPSGLDETTTFVNGRIVTDRMKGLKDGWGLYSSDFQKQLEEEWVSSLRQKYPVKINRKVLNEIQSVK
jgi:peptidyl-prolyl cis-trans isomerase SurA